MGKVYLIGAGPGDEELLTLKGKRLLETCSAVLYDRLAGSGFLKFLRDDCELYYCGKEPGCHYKSQQEINDMLVALALEGHTVGRVKGGDPYVFGRGGEEALRLWQEGIEFEVVPGISSAMAVPSYAGIPVSHRGLSQSVHIFTGQSATELQIDWNLVAKLSGTLVFLMGLERLSELSELLISCGKDPSTPSAVIMKGTFAAQRTVTASLCEVSDKVKSAGLRTPCVIVIGEVVSLRDQLAWYERKPLFGRNICITRAKEQSETFRDRLRDLGAEVTTIPTIHIEGCGHRLLPYLSQLSSYEHVVFTSANGVRVFFDCLLEHNIDVRCVTARIWAIGPATAAALKRRGIVPQSVPSEYVAEALFDTMKPHLKASDRILVARSEEARPYLVQELNGLGCYVDEVPIYQVNEGNAAEQSLLGSVDTVVFTSPSTVRNLIQMAGVGSLSDKKCVAIGPITAAELRKNNIQHICCDEYDIDGIVKKLLEDQGEDER